MRRLRVALTGVVGGVLASVVLSGCARESGSGNRSSPGSVPIELSRAPLAQKAAAEDEMAGEASLEFVAGEAEGDVPGRAYRSGASDYDVSAPASGPAPAAEEPMAAPFTAPTAPVEASCKTEAIPRTCTQP